MNRPTKLLLVVPIGIVIVGLLLTSLHGPYYLGDNLDPDYCYLLNAVNLLTFNTPGHTDHPGTTLQVLGAIVVFARWLLTGVFGRWQSLPEAVIGEPESYLLSINLFLNLLIGGLVYCAALRLYRLTASIWPSLVFQLSILPFLQTLVALTHVSPEPLLIAAGIGIAMPLIPVILGKSSDQETQRCAILAGVGFGFGLVTKVTFAPWLAVLFLFPKRQDKLRFILAGTVSTMLLLAPIYPRLPSAGRWFASILLHKGHYGSGALGVPDASSFLHNVQEQMQQVEPFLFFIAGIYCCLSLLSLLKSIDLGLAPIRRLLLVGCIAIALQVLMVAKHPSAHYLVPILVLPALLNSTICAHFMGTLTQVRSRRIFASVATAVLICGVSYGANRVRIWMTYTQSYVDEAKNLVMKDRTLQGCEFIGMYRASIPEYALAFGNNYAAGAQTTAIQELHPTLVNFDVFSGAFVSAGGQDRSAYVKDRLRHGGCLILQGPRVSESTRSSMRGIALEELGAGAREVIYRLGLTPDATPTDPLLAVPTFPKGTVTHEAEDLLAGNVAIDKVYWGLGIGVITAPKPPAFAEYRIEVAAAGTYDVYLRYASGAPRPVTLSVNGKIVTDHACNEVTGGFGPNDQRWQNIGRTQFALVNTLRLDRSGPFPHIDKIALVAVAP